MKIVIIRHAEPDYENNTLTEKGFIEAKALGKHYSASVFDDVYSSPLPRAKSTAEAVIKGEKEIKVRDWLIEFYHPVITPEGERHTNWDFTPSYLNKYPEIIKGDNYLEDYPPFKDVELKKKYDEVIKEFDEVLNKHGYHRNGLFYDVSKSSEETLVFFCHFGMMSVLLSHLLHVPYTLLAQFTVCLPTGVTTLVSEEREKGIASFRMITFGDISHLKEENIKPSFHGRFCEIFDSDDRH